jgi:uncharacterized protein (TIGR02145 family)
MTKNLRVKRYNDGTAIPEVASNLTWTELSTGARCWYSHEPDKYKETCGGLYNWYAVNSGKLCPAGWHVPSDEEWKTLEKALGLTQEQADAKGWRGTNEGNQMRSTSGWTGDRTGSNISGFSGEAGGCRNPNTGLFTNVTGYGFWWTGSQSSVSTAWFRSLASNYGLIMRNDDTSWTKKSGFSVRCVRN